LEDLSLTFPARRLRWLFFAALLCLALTACSGESVHLWLEAPGWSRARLVGETQTEFAVPPAQDAEGNVYLLLVSADEAGAQNLKLVKLSAQAEPLWEQEYALNAEQGIESPRAVWVDDGLQLLWIESDVLYSLRVNADGSQAGEAEALSNGHLASSYDAAVNDDGELLILYSGLRAHPGLYIYQAGESLLVDEQGYAPQLEFDAEGGLHAAWLQGRNGTIQRHVAYAYAADGVFQPDLQQIVYTISLPVTSTLSGFAMGLDTTHTYVFWSELTRTGLGAGGVDAKYVAFPYEPQGSLSERPLFFPNGYHLVYTPSGSGLLAGDRAQFADQETGMTSGLTELSPNGGSADELVIAFKSRLPYLRNKTAQQVGLVFMQGGQQVGGQLLSFNSITSERPALQSDESGYLYTSFLGGSVPPFRVYYAGTSPAIVGALNELDNQDYGQLAGETAFGLLSGLLLVPFILAWGLLPTLFIFFTGSFRKEGEWITARGTGITLVIALLLYWISKVAVMPGMVDYIPFSAWIPDIPVAVGLMLRVGVPLVTTLLALFVAYRMTYARERLQPLFFVLIFIILDGFASIAVYGVIFYSAI
jgi:hypothetical protein